eukprot:CAMPEP_0170541424 /NCGR_PEP_ID=MMETSP0211-20121228/1156_1 /TAXON_ID=311385 /ORGANISM="Pseudokeronopsis sp., Strain OXSARD2" /LENGTH=66 /DNA_ID=CAMNT_0010844137 /DNA_START=1080 /DNA_END=1280 /DNA_ORIENTATION=-
MGLLNEPLNKSYLMPEADKKIETVVENYIKEEEEQKEEEKERPIKKKGSKALSKDVHHYHKRHTEH